MENNNIVIRPMTIDDVDGVFEVEKNCFEHYWSKGEFEKEMKNDVARYLVADIDGKIVGYVGIWFVAGEGHITNVAVHSDYRGQKIGDILIKHLVKMCKDNNIFAMTLEVRVSNLNAIRFYKKRGFKEVAIRKFYYSNGEDAILMIK